jgi:hypothetical protein
MLFKEQVLFNLKRKYQQFIAKGRPIDLNPAKSCWIMYLYVQDPIRPPSPHFDHDTLDTKALVSILVISSA